jgi:hypothetical protein
VSSTFYCSLSLTEASLSHAVSKHNEATESTDDIRLGFPCDLIAVICISVRLPIERSIVSITYAVFRTKTQVLTPGTFNLMRYTLVLAVM